MNTKIVKGFARLEKGHFFGFVDENTVRPSGVYEYPATLTIEIPEPKIELTPSQLAEIVPKCAYQMRGPVDDIYVKVSDLVGHLFGEDEDEI